MSFVEDSALIQALDAVESRMKDRLGTVGSYYFTIQQGKVKSKHVSFLDKEKRTKRFLLRGRIDVLISGRCKVKQIELDLPSTDRFKVFTSGRSFR